eukprot:TRINITY_DN8553_c0_g1_i1.p2 TRINITY_DN8553_c0_g1~~TRINITY_DN8553_c0_g1_i1.p2  ORF type:complete len:286 (+),score=92.71 TRINITY_DN8553_c0_g1_i1:62-919(+)
MRAAAALALAGVFHGAAAHSGRWEQLPLGPLGVPGFPDCVAPEGAPRGGPADDRELDRRNAALKCAPRPKTAGQIAVACVGDSITAGVHSSGGVHTYPGQLQEMLDAKYPGKYVVTNYGACGSTMQKGADSPYWERPQYPAVMKSNADIVIIMLGTNDAKDLSDHGPPNWENDNKTGQKFFVADYDTMISEFKQFKSDPDIYVAVPPPLYKPGVYGMNQTVINDVFPGLMPRINAHNKLPYKAIDVFNALGGKALSHPEWSSDGCHPNDAGYTQLAKAVLAGLHL